MRRFVGSDQLRCREEEFSVQWSTLVNVALSSSTEVVPCRPAFRARWGTREVYGSSPQASEG